MLAIVPQRPGPLVPPLILQPSTTACLQEGEESEQAELGPAASVGGLGLSPTTAAKRERLLARNAILRSTGFIEVQHSAAVIGECRLARRVLGGNAWVGLGQRRCGWLAVLPQGRAASACWGCKHCCPTPAGQSVRTHLLICSCFLLLPTLLVMQARCWTQ